MRKTLLVALREYVEAVRSKGFVIGILVAPLFMFGSLIAIMLLREQVDTSDKRIAVVDRSAVVAGAIAEAARARNENRIFDRDTGAKKLPAYIIEVVEPEGDAEAQRLHLSDDVRSGRLVGFLEIEQDVVSRGGGEGVPGVAYYTENAGFGDVPQWLGEPVNSRLRALRADSAGLDVSVVESVTRWAPVEIMGLVQVDEATGAVTDAKRADRLLSLIVPLVMAMLLFLMIMMAAMPLLYSTLEEKSQRISEVILGSVRPIELMTGKLIGGVAVSLTAMTVYVVAGIFALNGAGLADACPYHAIPWFLVFALSAVTMNGALFMAVGAACNDVKETQSLMFPIMIPLMVSMSVFVPVIREPTSAFSTWMSLFPLFTPLLMTVRITVPGGAPLWQAWVGLGGVVVCTAVFVWAAGRVMRVGLLMQGKAPKMRELFRWIVKG